MYEDTFPHSAQTIVTALIRLCEKQKLNDIVNLLRMSKPQVVQTDYDNWNGGTYFYTLFLNITIDLFAEIEPRAKEFEATITEKINAIFRGDSNQHINNVLIVAQLEEDSTPIAPAIGNQKADHLWEDGYLRLFLCHVAVHKVAIATLKRELHVYGISAFVAHEDIEPCEIWRNEINKALSSMHALAAFLTPEFHASNWTDQEVGFALGRCVPTIPVRLGLDPYGFLGVQQGLSGNLEIPSNLASDLVDILLKNDLTKSVMQESLVVALEKSASFLAAKNITIKIEGIDSFTMGQLNRMEAACRDNSQVNRSFGVPDKINAVVRRLRPIEEDDLPF